MEKTIIESAEELFKNLEKGSLFCSYFVRREHAEKLAKIAEQAIKQRDKYLAECNRLTHASIAEAMKYKKSYKKFAIMVDIKDRWSELETYIDKTSKENKKMKKQLEQAQKTIYALHQKLARS